MFFLRNALAGAAVLFFSTAVWSDTVRLENGDDTFFAGDIVNETLDTSGDAFASARIVVARGVSQGDLHATGFDVTVSADTSEDLYAFGGTVVVRGNIAEDLTIAGFSVRTESSSETNGNARLFGNSVTIEGPVAGALIATGLDVILNAPIDGDVRILAKSISFGPNAIIAGTFTYSTEEKITVPERVAPSERVVFKKFSASDAWDEWDSVRNEMPVLPSFASLFFGFIVSLLFFVALGAVMLSFMPRRLEKMRQRIASAPGRSMLIGVIGLSVLFGLVPVTGLTIIGLPFVPIAILGIVVVWTLGYALGAYSVAMKIWIGFGGDAEPSNVSRLLVFAAAITLIAMLNFIPFVGWLANYTLVLLGIGAITSAAFQYLIGNSCAAFDVDMKPMED